MAFPYRQYSSETQALQGTLNQIIESVGGTKVTVDGYLGPETCNALTKIVKSGKYPNFSVPSTCSTGGGEYASLATSNSNTGRNIAIVGVVIALLGLSYYTYKQLTKEDLAGW